MIARGRSSRSSSAAESAKHRGRVRPGGAMRTSKVCSRISAGVVSVGSPLKWSSASSRARRGTGSSNGARSSNGPESRPGNDNARCGWRRPKRSLRSLTKNIGLKLAGVAAAVILGMLFIMSLRTPDSGEAKFNEQLHTEVSLLVRERGMRLQRGMVLSFQNRPTMGSINCADGLFSDFLNFVLNVERENDPPLDPGVPAEDMNFRDRYAGSINCVGTLGDRSVVDDVLQRTKRDLHPYRLEDLLSIMVRVGGGVDPRVLDALDDRNDTTRHFAALSIIHGGDQSGVRALVESPRQRGGSGGRGGELRADRAHLDRRPRRGHGIRKGPCLVSQHRSPGAAQRGPCAGPFRTQGGGARSSG